MQELKVIKTTNKTYKKALNQINEMIKDGYIIHSMNPIVTNSYKSGLGTFSVETEILIFLLVSKVDDNMNDLEK